MKLCECGCGRHAPLSKRTRSERGQVAGQPVRFIRGHAFSGKTHTLATRQQMSVDRTGVRHTAKSRALMAAIAKRGPDHPDWKAEAIAYSTIHRWIARVATKTGTCTVCGSRRITHWANISGEYRRNVSDFAEMCVPCHMHYDRSRRLAS